MKTTMVVMALTGVLSSTGPWAAAPPVGREALIQILQTPSLPAPFPPPSFVAADFVLPRATTDELAEFARTQGGADAAAWLCDTYATAPVFDPESASLSGLVATAAAQGSAQAADTLVCPKPRARLRERVTKVTNPGCIFFGDCHVVTYWVMSHDVAYANCPSPGESPRNVDSAMCQKALGGRSGRAVALRFFARRAARRHACLILRLSGTGALQLYGQATEHIIGDLLGLFRITTTEEPVADVSLQAVVASALDKLQAQVGAKRIRVAVGELPMVQGQAAKLEHAVANLLSNAVKYVPRGAGVVEVSAEARDGDTTLCVRDNGVGIEPRYHRTIFELFTRVPAAGQVVDGAEVDGTGVGLAIVKRVVEEHGGRVWVESNVGAGSAFYLLLPSLVLAPREQTPGHRAA